MAVDIRPIRESELGAMDHWLWHWPGLHGHRYDKQRAGEVVYLVAWDGDVPVGHVLLSWNCPDLPEVLPRCADISDLFVHPGHRQKGIASEMVCKAEQLALAAGYDEVGLSVGIHHREAWRLYHHLGYRPCHFLPYRNEGRFVDSEGKVHSWCDEVRYFTKDLHRSRHEAAEKAVVSTQETRTLL